MIRSSALWLLVLSTASCYAVAEEGAELKTDQQKFSYFIGLQIGQSLQRQDMKIDEPALFLAIRDSLAGQQPRLSKDELQAVVARSQEQMKKEQQAKAEKNLAAGKAFLAENKKKEGVTELASGLQYRVVEKGTGAKPKLSDTVSVHYRGTLIDGKEFDSSHRGGQPASFQVSNIIKGWQEALPMMPEGAKWQVFVPPDLAYGTQGSGGVIGPNATLIFDIELLAINHPEKGEKADQGKKQGNTPR